MLPNILTNTKCKNKTYLEILTFQPIVGAGVHISVIAVPHWNPELAIYVRVLKIVKKHFQVWMSLASHLSHSGVADAHKHGPDSCSRQEH